MGIRFHISLSIFVFMTNLVFAQTEEQRKYVFDHLDEIENFIRSSDSTEKLSTFHHSKYEQYDIYLDSPDFLLLKNKMSLRFRKQISETRKRPVTYTFQLKSEMEHLNSARMEVEETELDFYLVKSPDGWIPTPNIAGHYFCPF